MSWQNALRWEKTKIDNHEVIQESQLATKYVNLDLLIKQVFEHELMAVETYNQTYSVIKHDDSNQGLKIIVTRLPYCLYSEKFDGLRSVNQALSRHNALKKRIHSQRNGVLKKWKINRMVVFDQF